MNKQFTVLLIALMFVLAAAKAQEESAVLFTVEGKPVTRSEFNYIYKKTNGKEANFSEASLEEYLDLYIKFKLKVQKAEDMQLDTIPSLKKELEGYRRKLADSYLIDKEVTEKLTKEAYERAKQDVEISHILFNIPATASSEEAQEIYNKALGVRKMIGKKSFEEVAKEFSDDKSVSKNGGYIGFINVLFPDGYYNLETAAYELPLNTLSEPIRTSAGYHILKVHSRRPARGDIEVAHILIRSDNYEGDLAKQKIDSIYQLLEAEANFEEMAERYSEDGRSASKGGYLGFFGINQLQTAFEEAAYTIPEDGQYSKPIQTTIGWHIIKRISKRKIQPYQIEKSRLQQLVKKDGRHEEAKLAMIERIKKEGNLRLYEDKIKTFADTVADNLLTFKWKAPAEKSSTVIMELGDRYQVTLGDFTDYLGSASRDRIRMGRTTEIPAAVKTLFDRFVESEVMRYEETQLEKKYPEFKYLMNEYEEGILLFEVTKMEVWDKASQDTTGLKAHYERVKDKFRWDERAKAVTYYILPEAKNQLQEIKAYIADHNMKEVLEKYNIPEKNLIRAEEKMAEKTKDNLFFKMPWEEKAISEIGIDGKTKNFFFTKIEEIIPPTTKTLDEARGYIIADYQEYLEREWIRELRKQYDVEINKKVFKSLIQ